MNGVSRYARNNNPRWSIVFFTNAFTVWPLFKCFPKAKEKIARVQAKTSLVWAQHFLRFLKLILRNA